MFRLTAKIEIKSARTWVFDKITSCEIVRDTDTLTDTCVLQLPRKVKWQGEADVPIKRGDAITVWLGYDDNLQLAFKGYVTTIGIKAPLVINCEDEMFALKAKATKKLSYASVTLEKLLGDQDMGGVKVRVLGEQNIGQYRIKADTVSALLGHLKDNGIRCFFKLVDGDPVLYCGVLFPFEGAMKQSFITGRNLISDDNLKIQNAADVKIKIKAISLQPDNKKKIRIEVGDTDGERRTLHAYNKTEAELKAWAEQELERLKRDGLVGSFSTFGWELVDKLDVVGIIIDGIKRGKYQTTKNVITYGAEGFRQEITIGGRVNE